MTTSLLNESVNHTIGLRNPGSPWRSSFQMEELAGHPPGLLWAFQSQSCSFCMEIRRLPAPPAKTKQCIWVMQNRSGYKEQVVRIQNTASQHTKQLGHTYYGMLMQSLDTRSSRTQTFHTMSPYWQKHWNFFLLEMEIIDNGSGTSKPHFKKPRFTQHLGCTSKQSRDYCCDCRFSHITIIAKWIIEP